MPASEPRKLRAARGRMFGGLVDDVIADRVVHVWVPPDLVDASDGRPVIYACDGQNLFGRGQSLSGQSWQLDEALRRLGRADVQLPIVVGVEHPPKRRAEYLHPQALAQLPALREIFVSANGEPQADLAIDRLADQIKPVIDARFPTLTDAANTFVMGSSMGGLFSMFAISRRPEVFSAAAALSLHWQIVGRPLVDILADGLPDASTHRIYVDHGTLTLDARYLDKQPIFDELARGRGYTDGTNYLSIEYPRTQHTESAWAARVVVPLVFLLVGTQVAAGLAPAFGGAPKPAPGAGRTRPVVS
jgi:predicted alpha/beta superfamily hydrolase